MSGQDLNLRPSPGYMEAELDELHKAAVKA